MPGDGGSSLGTIELTTDLLNFEVYDMQVTLETAEGLLRRLSVTVPAAQVDEAVEKRLKDLSRRVRMDGFRPGKAPMLVVRQRYGEQARDEVVGDLIQRTYVDAITQNQLRPAGGPSITEVDMIVGEGLRYVAEIEVYPDITLADLSTLEVEPPKAEILKADVEAMIGNLRKQRATFEAVDREAADGDRVIVDFKGSIDGELFDGGSATDMPIELGKGQLLKDFEGPIIGMKAGETKTIEVTFPDDYHADHLQGKTASFEVTVKKVEQTVLPEIDDEFCLAFGVKDGGAETLEAEVRKNMERELATATKRRVKQQVMDGLLAAHEGIAMPKALVVEEAERVREQFSQQMRGAKADQLPLNIFEPEAERRVRLGMLVAELVRSEGLKVDAARVDALLDEIASSYEDPTEVKVFYKSRPDLMRNLEALAAEDMVVDHVLSRAKVTDVSMRFDEVVKPQEG
ncbi:MAG: trigger factor [Halothiobacillaceae bacterium]|nr:MAG: trigger factor [Halothiobacillaceae bacterium]